MSDGINFNTYSYSNSLQVSEHILLESDWTADNVEFDNQQKIPKQGFKMNEKFLGFHNILPGKVTNEALYILFTHIYMVWIEMKFSTECTMISYIIV